MHFNLKLPLALSVGLLLIGLFVGHVGLNSDLSNDQAVVALPQTLKVSINPQGPVLMTLNQIQRFTANVSVEDAEANYEWSIENASADSSINGTEHLLVTQGKEASFQFLMPSIDNCWLNVTVESNNQEATDNINIQYISSQPNPTSKPQNPTQQYPTQTQTQQTTSNQTQNNNISYAPPLPLNPNYIIQKTSDNLYQAINCSNGNIDFSSTDADSIFHNVFAYPDIQVEVSSGIYNLNSSITVKNNQHLSGYGATINMTLTSIKPTRGPAVFCSDKPINNTIIEGFTIQLHADGYFNQGIYLNNPHNCTLQNNKIYDAYNRGISLDGWAYNYGGSENKILNNYVEKTYSDQLGETIVLGNQNDSRVSGNVVIGSQQGGITLSGCFRVEVTGNTISYSDGQNVGYGGIDLEASSNNTITDNTINGKGTGTGIRVSRGAYNNTFNHNNISNVAYGIKLIDTMGPASYNSFSNNNISNTIIGISICSNTCNFNTFTNNTITATGKSIEDYGSYNSY
ncbi:MAG: right-handed parallel beta-helix repeat-containing protein [Candidatus Bathyarchaeota archaeon]|nr:right-handed parallel beta-helix repeat-containing protein [Candidatus Bathyarchaeota archaeon]